MTWFEELGFDENPFDTDPGVSTKSSVGLDKPMGEVEYCISSGSIVFVEGAEGSGKSVLLKKLDGKIGTRAAVV